MKTHTRFFSIRRPLESFQSGSALSRALFELALFRFKQGWACLYGGLLLLLLLVTHYFYPAHWPLAPVRCDSSPGRFRDRRILRRLSPLESRERIPVSIPSLQVSFTRRCLSPYNRSNGVRGGAE